MAELKHWISAARLRTLPLAFAVIALGTGLAYKVRDGVDWRIFALAVFTSFAYQVLSNYANDLGDGMRGTDDHRTGEKRAIASGLITIPAMKRAVRLWTVLALISGGTLVFLAFYGQVLFYVFFALNIAAVAAATSYTMGPKPYAYWGGGDFFVFLFFGLVGVLGSAALYAPLHGSFVLPALVANCYDDCAYDAPTCPNCGQRWPNQLLKQQRIRRTLLYIGLFVAFVIASFVGYLINKM